MKPAAEHQENDRDLLTGIHPSYTLAAAPERSSELDEMVIRNFLNTLAEVSLAIASRKIKENSK